MIWIHTWRRSLYFKRQYRNPKESIRRASSLPICKNTTIVFSWILDGPSNSPNAMSIAKGLIVVNAEWAARLTLFDEEEVWDAFRLTIGHELTHQSGDYVLLKTFTCDQRFVNWVSEVHADFGGSIRAFAGNMDKTISAIRYKAKAYKRDKDHQAHPSWKRREKYIKTGRFGEELIKRIAEDVGCRNKGLIDNVCKFYDPIILEV